MRKAQPSPDAAMTLGADDDLLVRNGYMPVAALFHVDWENMQIGGTPDNSALEFTRISWRRIGIRLRING